MDGIKKSNKDEKIKKVDQNYVLLFSEYCGEDKNVYQELAEKDHYLLLAAEAGKVLLEKNQELSDQYSKLQDEYMHKIEVPIYIIT